MYIYLIFDDDNDGKRKMTLNITLFPYEGKEFSWRSKFSNGMIMKKKKQVVVDDWLITLS